MRRRAPDVENQDSADAELSKTQVKDAMLALQDLGAALLELPDAWLDALEMPERLRDALAEYHRIPTMNAQKRQLGFIGKLLRSVDIEPLQLAVETHQQNRAREAGAFRNAERWRERLLSDEGALTAWCAEYPGGDLRALRQLIAKARQEEAAAKAEAEAGAPLRKGRYYRELFQLLAARVRAPAAGQD